DNVVSFNKETKKVNLRNILFTDEDIRHIKTFLTYIEETYQNSLKAFETVDHQLARRTIQSKSTIDEVEKDVNFEHFNSLIDKREHNPDISAVYLDIVN